MPDKINELFSIPTFLDDVDWQLILENQYCPFIDKKCVKIRKSQPEVSIGTCSVHYGADENKSIVICPHRFLGSGQIFFDCLHLLTLHEPGNELHKISEVELPGGSVDYFLVSVQDGQVIDFVGIELQAVDTTGTLWPARQAFLKSQGILNEDTPAEKPYGMNWKMTAKTTLVQLHHKIETFENLGKHLVLVLQDSLLDYMRREFKFDHIQSAKLGHSMHFHAYEMQKQTQKYHLKLASRLSTDANGMAKALGLQDSANVELEVLLATLQSKISPKTLLKL
jgi:hypothetical protein